MKIFYFCSLHSRRLYSRLLPVLSLQLHNCKLSGKISQSHLLQSQIARPHRSPPPPAVRSRRSDKSSDVHSLYVWELEVIIEIAIIKIKLFNIR